MRADGPRLGGRREDVTMQPRLTVISKYLAKYLRHAPGELGLTLQPGGLVPVDDLLAAPAGHGFPSG